ncbi:MAG: PQQ-binding-like beta-propeller repeat protein [Phycisphaerae bacterium]|nr:PQQ-binding-like beta-propeller repeat protein [Phycisphaerae bacterium]
MRWISPVIVAWSFLAMVPAGAVGEADLVASAGLAPVGLVKYWQCPIPLKPDERILQLHLEEEMIYALTDLGAVYAIDADVGLVRWSAPVTEPPLRLFRPCHPMTSGGEGELLTVVASPTDIMVFHRLTGRLQAKVKMPITPAGPPIADNDSVYIGGVNNRYYAFRAVQEGIHVLEPKKKGLKWYAVIVLSDGKRLYHEAETLVKAREWQEEWLHTLGGPQTEEKSAMMRWQVHTGGNVRARPAVVKRTAYIPSDAGKLFACRLSGKRKEWEVAVPGAILADPLVGKGMVYFASTARSVYAYDRLRGTRVWQRHLPAPLDRTGAVTEKRLYQPGEPTGVYAIDPMKGTLLWTFEPGTDFLAEQEEFVYLFQSGQAIHQVEGETGASLRIIPAPDATLSVSNVRDTTLYVASADGRLMCIRPRGVPYLRRASFERAKAGPPRAPAKGKGGPTTQQAAPAPGEKASAKPIADDPLRSRSDMAPAVSPKP